MWSVPGPQFNRDYNRDSWTFQPRDFAAPKMSCRLIHDHFLCCNLHSAFWHFGIIHPLWTQLQFDATLGYPGEGPSVSNMTLVSANIGSVMTDITWKTWGAHVVCLQGTRVGRNNHRSASKIFQSLGFTPCFGDLLPGLWHGSKSTKTPCGGTLIAGGAPFIRAFEIQHDATGLHGPLFKTKRVVAAWLQVTPKKRAFVVSIYATTSASQDPRIHAENNQLFENILAFVAQFGASPIIVAGDLQAPRSSYPALASAMSFQSWHEPVATVGDDGEVIRPITFSNDGSFAGPGDGCTSIDSVLVNDIAFSALSTAEVLQTFGKQHRPIKLVFNWDSINQVGFHLLKTAQFVLDSCLGPQVDSFSSQWHAHSKTEFDNASNSEEKWSIVNGFLQQTLLAKGAS